MGGPITPAHALLHRRFGLLPVRSPLLGESLLLSLPAGTKMFQFPAFASGKSPDVGIAPHGLPHSDICGSMRICRSPQLFAACHVLPRLREPRHPPCALSRSVISLQDRTKFDNVVAIDLLDCETSVVFLLLSLAIDSLELIHDCQSASSMSLSFFLSGEPRGGQAP